MHLFICNINGLEFIIDSLLYRIMEFAVKIGDSGNSESCRHPRDRNEGIVVDFSTDNGITWQVLKVVEPSFEDITPSTVTIELPSNAKHDRTIFRFWQPLGLGGEYLCPKYLFILVRKVSIFVLRTFYHLGLGGEYLCPQYLSSSWSRRPRQIYTVTG